MFLDIFNFLEEISSPSYSKAFLSHVLFSALSWVYLCHFPCPLLLFFSQLFVKPQYSTTLPPVMKRSFCVFVWLVGFCISSRRSSWNCSSSASSASVVGAQTWITVMLSGLLCKWTKIILLFLRLHPSTAFWSLLLAMRAASLHNYSESLKIGTHMLSFNGWISKQNMTDIQKNTSHQYKGMQCS